MSLHEDVIFSDPVLYRAFFETRRFAAAADHEAIVNIALGEIARLELAFHKATLPEVCERVAWQIRRHYFLVRRHCDGYYMDTLSRLVDDGCEHVVQFEFADNDSVFNIDYRARAAYRHRYGYRPSAPSRKRPRRTRSV